MFWCLHSSKLNAQTYQSLNLDGFNADVIANGTGTALASTNNDVDGVSYAFKSIDWKLTATSTAQTTGLPVGGLITSANNANLNFQLKGYSDNNAIRISAINTPITSNVTNAVHANKLIILATGGSGNAIMGGTINFTDGTTQSFSNIDVQDWYNSTPLPIAFQNFGRINRTDNNVENGPFPALFQATVAIDVANQTKTITSIIFKKESGTGILNIFAASLEVLPTCPSPSTAAFTLITTNSATATWTAPSIVPTLGYEYELRTTGLGGSGAAGLVTNNTTTALSVNFSTLLANTNYKLYIRSKCSATDLGSWNLVGNFTTLCGISTVPYFEGFETGHTHNTVPSLCWGQSDVSGWEQWTANNTESTYNRTPRTGNWNAFLKWSNEDWMIRSFQLEAGVSYRFKFYVRQDGSNINDVSVKVNYGTGATPADLTNVIVPQTGVVDGNYQEIIGDFQVATSGVYQIGINGSINLSPWYISIDDISLDVAPACPDVTNVTITNITKNEATLNWSSVSVPSNGYEYEVRTTGLPGTPGAVDEGTTIGTVTTADIIGLTPSTEYFVYVRAKCEGNTFGSWSLEKKFKTLCDYPDIISTTAGSVCGLGTVNLNAVSSSNVVRWYANETGGNVLHTGNDFTSPTISTTTSYWAEATGTNIVTGNVGEVLPVNGISLSFPGSGVVFNLAETTKLISTDVFSATAGTINIQILNSSNVEVFSTGNVNVVNGGTTTPNVIPLNVELPAGTEYKMLLKEFNQAELYVAGVSGTYPYLGAGGSVEMTSSYFFGPSIDLYMYFFNILFEKGCNSVREEVVATVTPAPTITLSNTNVTICEGASELVTITDGASNYSTITVSPTTGVTGDATTGFTFSPTESLQYVLTAVTSGANICTKEITINVQVNPNPVMLSMEDEYEVCLNTVQELKAGDETVWQMNNVSGFEDYANSGFIHENLSGTTTVASNTTYYSEGVHSVLFNHLESSKGNYTLQNSLNLVDFNNLYIEFDHIAALESSNSWGASVYDFGIVEYSTDGGATWTTFKPSNYIGTSDPSVSDANAQRFSKISYTDWNSTLSYEGANPTNSLWKTERFNIPSNIDLDDFKIRFVLQGDGSTNYKGWYIDNVKVKGERIPITTWTPITNLYTDELATVPYLAGEDAATVYYKSTVAHTPLNYMVTVANSLDCEITKEFTVETIETPAPVIDTNVYCLSNTLNEVTVTHIAGADLKWYDAPVLGNELPLTTTLVDGTAYYLAQVVDGCESYQRAELVPNLTVTIAPTTNAISQEFCIATQATIASIQISGTEVKWYDAAVGGNELANSDILQTAVYYASQKLDGCESVQRLVVTVTVHNTPAPTATETLQKFCIEDNAALTAMQVLGTDVKWYNVANGGSPLAMSTQLEDGVVYYATQILNGCESVERLAITAWVQEVLAPISSNVSQSFCSINNPTITDIDLIGNGLKWYDAAVGGNLLPVSTPLVDGTTYYASQSVTTCESEERLGIQVNVAVNTPLTSTAIQLCTNTSILDVVIDGFTSNDLRWYTSQTSTTPLSSSQIVVTGTYYISKYLLNTCESLRKPIQVVLLQQIPAPTVANSLVICGGGTVADLQAQPAQGGTVNWYISSQSDTPLAVTEPLSNGTYYVEQTVGNCKSVKKPVAVHVISTIAPIVSPFILCAGATVADLAMPAATNTTYEWFINGTTTTPLASNYVLTTGYYFVAKKTFTCVSNKTMVHITVNPRPLAPTGDAHQYFIDYAYISDFVLNEPNVLWYNTYNEAMTNTSPSPQSMPLVDGHTYFAVLMGDGGCASLPYGVTAHITLGTKDLDLTKLKYYPNPVSSELNIEYTEAINKVEVYSILGQKVLSTIHDGATVKLDMSSLSAGNYMVRIETKSGAQFVKIVKK